MPFQVTLLTECMIAYATGVWPIPTMCALMFVQNTLMTECLITYNTRVWLFPTM